MFAVGPSCRGCGDGWNRIAADERGVLACAEVKGDDSATGEAFGG